MQALTAAASSGNMDLLEWIIHAFNVTLTDDNGVGVLCYVIVPQHAI